LVQPMPSKFAECAASMHTDVPSQGAGPPNNDLDIIIDDKENSIVIYNPVTDIKSCKPLSDKFSKFGCNQSDS